MRGRLRPEGSGGVRAENAFALAELHPRTDKGLGVLGPNLVKALGHQLGRKAAKLTTDQEDGALHAVRAALASGYVAFMSVEPDNGFSVEPHLDLRRVWAISVVHFRGHGARVLGLPDDLITSLEHMGEDALHSGLERANVIKRRKQRMGSLGAYYAHAGAFMRVAQTDINLPGRAALLTEMGTEHWPYDAYVINGHAPRS